MKNLSILIVVCVTCFSYQVSAQPISPPQTDSYINTEQELNNVFEHKNEVKYMKMLPDIPLINGLEALPEISVTFDKPDGRIVESFFYSEQVSAEDVDYFYMQTLPQLGWIFTETLSKPSVYVREGEQLTVKSTQSEGALIVQFSLSPQ